MDEFIGEYGTSIFILLLGAGVVTILAKIYTCVLAIL
jgi:hypothetical protein